MTDPTVVVELFRDLQNETKEKLIAISVDAKLKIITFEVVSIGSVSAISLRPFEILRTPVVVNAFGVILVHNHPSGDPKPSAEDKKLTKTVAKLADSGGIAFHDHIIIGDDDHYSFRTAGLLDKKTK
ncbi:MAG: JAB domain-containing protein [Planctomycetota bacterium]